MSAVLISAIPPQPYVDAKYPIHLANGSQGQRIIYGSSGGVVVRGLPDQVSFNFKPVETFPGAKRPITCAVMSPDGRAVVGGDNDGYCYVWSKQKGSTDFNCYKLDELQYVRMTDVAVSPDGRRIAIVGIDRYSARLAATITLDGGMAVGQLTGHKKGITACHFRPKKPFTLLSAGLDGLICTHDGPPFKIKSTHEAHQGGCMAARYSNCGDFVASGGCQGDLTVWKAATMEKLVSMQLDGSPSINDLSWSPNESKFLSVVASDGCLRLLDRNHLNVVQSLLLGSTPENVPKGVTWSARGWIVTVCAGGHLKGWKLQDAFAKPQDISKLEAELEDFIRRDQEEEDITELQLETAEEGNLDRDSKLSGDTKLGGDAEIQVKEQAGRKEGTNVGVRKIAEEGDTKSDLVIKETDTQRVTQAAKTASKEGTRHIKTLDSLAVPELSEEADFTWYGPRGNPTCIDFDTETGNIAVGTSLGFMMFLKTNQTIPSAFQVSRFAKENTVKSCILCAKCAAAVTADGCLKVFRIKTTNLKASELQGKVKLGLEAYGEGQTSVYTPPSKHEVALAATANVDKIPLKVIFLEENKYIAMFCFDGTLQVYSVEKALAHEKANEDLQPEWSVVLLGKPTTVTATPDGSLLAVALWPCDKYPNSKFGEKNDGGDEEVEDDNAESQYRDTSKPLIELYEVDSAGSLDGFRFICVLDLFSSEVTSISLNEEGSLLACVDLKRNITVLEVESRVPIITTEWNLHSTKVAALDWSPDGSKLVSASTNEIYVWDVENVYNYITINDCISGSVAFVKFLFNNIVLAAGTDGVMRTYELEFYDVVE